MRKPTDKEEQILTMWDLFEEGEPDISTERLAAMTANACHVDEDAVYETLWRHRSSKRKGKA